MLDYSFELYQYFHNDWWVVNNSAFTVQRYCVHTVSFPSTKTMNAGLHTYVSKYVHNK